MSYKKVLFMIVLATLVCGSANAQSFLERLGQRAKNAAENAIGNKVENAVNNAIDNVGKKKDKKNDKTEPAEDLQQQVPPLQLQSLSRPACRSVPHACWS